MKTSFASFGERRRFDSQQRMLSKLSPPVVAFRVSLETEGCCMWCGSPIDSGDTAFEAECDEREEVLVFCTRSCNRKDLEDFRTEEANDAMRVP